MAGGEPAPPPSRETGGGLVVFKTPPRDDTDSDSAYSKRAIRGAPQKLLGELLRQHSTVGGYFDLTEVSSAKAIERPMPSKIDWHVMIVR